MSQNQGKDFESVELGEMNDSAGPQPQREKAPRRVIHFSSGETMEEYSTDEEEEGGEPEKRDLLSSPVDAVRVRSGRQRGLHSGSSGAFIPVSWIVFMFTVKDDVGTIFLVPHVESSHLNHLRFVCQETTETLSASLSYTLNTQNTSVTTQLERKNKETSDYCFVFCDIVKEKE